MAKYLRDQIILSVRVDEELILHLDSVFQSRAHQLNLLINAEDSEKLRPFLIYVLRFDGKGIHFFSVEEMLSCFESAGEVDRIVMTIETPSSRNSNRQFGEYAELRLDKENNASCYIQVSADNSDWVDSTYSSVLDAISKNKTKFRYARSAISRFTIQMCGVASAFLLSLWAALVISPSFKVESAFVLVFLFALLLFSNIWTHLSHYITAKVDSVFPNVYFFRAQKQKLNWLYQGLIVGAATALGLYALSTLFSVIGEFLKGLAK